MKKNSDRVREEREHIATATRLMEEVAVPQLNVAQKKVARLLATGSDSDIRSCVTGLQKKVEGLRTEEQALGQQIIEMETEQICLGKRLDEVIARRAQNDRSIKEAEQTHKDAESVKKEFEKAEDMKERFEKNLQDHKEMIELK